MDTLNSHLEAASVMSASETHSDKTVSDEEDFKTNIPYFAETNGTSCRQRSNTEEDDDDPATFNYPNWDNDDGFIDRMSHMEEADYPAFPAGENHNIYPVTSPETPDYPNEGMQDIKYSPDEMVFRPPATSSLHYNYPHPSQGQPPPPPPPHTFPQRQTHMHGSQGPYGGYGHHPPGIQQPNMWYPNAPYGTGGFGSYAAYGHGPQRYAPYNAGYTTHDPMMDMLQLSNSGREARNRAEKNRRDKLNGSIQELSTMVPHVAESPRRVDKTAVLRFAAHGLRLNYVFGETMNQYRPQVTDALMKLLDSFFITLTCHGQIVLISSSIEQHLGHCQTDLYGQNILHITHPGDHAMLKQQLIPTDLEHLLDIQPDDDSGDTKPRTSDEEENIDRKLRADKRSFTVRLARAGPRSEPTAYEVVKLDGIFRRSDAAPRGEKTNTFSSSLQLIRRTRGRDDSIPLHTISGNDIVLVAIARIIRPPKIINRVMESNALEYKTRHLIDGRIIDCDQRIGLVAGYMTDEVRNLSPFTFMHQDDVRWVIVALRQMYDCNSSYGESTYRLLTRNGNFIYLQSKGYLEIDKDTNKVHSFVCINTLLEEDEGKRRVQEMKNKFSIIINTKIPQSSIDAPASDNPQQLEKAVLCLIQNLQKSASDDEEADSLDTDHVSGSSQVPALSSSPDTKRKFTIPHQHQNTMSSARVATSCSSKTPPLALVPPEASTVKNSILKSVSVVNVTAAKHLRDHQRVKSPMSAVDDCDLDLNAQQLGCTCELNGTEFCDFCQASNSQLTAGIKRNMSYADSDDIKPAKRRFKTTEIEQVLSTSLDQIGRTLNEQLNAAIELRDQSNKYDVPNSHQRIEEIMVEHQKQSEIYVNIKSEYEVQIQNKGIDANTTKTTDPQSNVDLKQR